MSIFDRLTQSGQRRRQASALAAQLMRNEQEDRERFPDDAQRWTPFLRTLQEALEEYGASNPEQPVNASVRFYITEDRMNAYVCMLPPLDGGEELLPGEFGRQLQRSGICAGLEEDAVLAALAKRQYLHLIPVARGIPPQDGIDGVREDLFEPRPVYVIDLKEGKTADFAPLSPVQLIERGEPVCRITPPVPGRAGTDVTGRTLPFREGIPAEVFIGHNTALSEDGLRLEATENGAVFVRDGHFFVQTACVRRGTLQANDNLVWMAYIAGDVPEGIKIEATNNVFIMGEARGAEIRSNGSVRVQRGIRQGCKIEAQGQVLAPVIEDSQVFAGKAVFAEEIRDSEITCAGSVFVLGGGGLIQGGMVRAGTGVECLRVGDASGGQNRFYIGCAPELFQENDRLTGQLGETQATLDILRKSSLKLRKGGEALPLEKRKLLNQLNEQKKLYETRAAELDAQLQKVQEALRAARGGRLLCQEMNPVTVVQIGDRTGEFTHRETRCNVHIYAGKVVSK